MISNLTLWVVPADCRHSEHYCRHCLDHCRHCPDHCSPREAALNCVAEQRKSKETMNESFPNAFRQASPSLISPFCTLPLHSALSLPPSAYFLPLQWHLPLEQSLLSVDKVISPGRPWRVAFRQTVNVGTQLWDGGRNQISQHRQPPFYSTLNNSNVVCFFN